MEIRPARSSDIPEVARLWATAFPGRRTAEERARMLETGGRYGGLETVLVVRTEDGALAGATKIYALSEFVTGVPMPMMGLAAVAVAPGMRRRGIAARLCAEAIRVAADRGDVVSVLYPFRPDYYERLGWGLVGRLVEHRFATSSLPRHPEAVAVRAARWPDDLDGITACYAGVAERGHGPIARDRRVWAYRLTGEELGVRPLDEALAFEGPSDPHQATVVYDDGGISGYALLRTLRPDDADRRTLVVRELIAAGAAAYRGLLGHLASRADSWPRARHYARAEERFGDRLVDPRPPGFTPARSLYFPTGRVIQGPMLRIVDVRRALERRRWFDAGGAPDSEASFTVTIRDELRPDHQGTWRVRVGPGGEGARVERAGEDTGGGVDGTEPGRPADLRLAGLSADISTFSRIWAGELTPSEAVRLERATIVRAPGNGFPEGASDPALAGLDSAFATREGFWLFDEF